MKEDKNYTQTLQYAEDGHIKLDYTLKTPEERNELVKIVIENTPPEKLTKRYLTAMADYIIEACEKEIGEHKIIKKSRLNNTIKVRETSLEGLSASFENKYSENGHNNTAEDYVYNLIIENDKNIIMTPKQKITPEDLEEIPDLKELWAEIKRLENQVFPLAKGQQRFSVKKNIIDLYKDAYVLKASFKGAVHYSKPLKSSTNLDIYENITIDADGGLQVDSNLSLLDPKHVSAMLCKYSKLKQDSYSKFTSDIYYMMLDLDKIATEALKNYPLYEDIVINKIDGLQNKDIQKKIEEKYDIKYSVEYISSLWRNKIPKMIAETAQKKWLVWHYTEEEVGTWKKCSRCGQIKLAHPKFFSKNKSSKDNFYSICKECRNKKQK